MIIIEKKGRPSGLNVTKHLRHPPRWTRRGDKSYPAKAASQSFGSHPEMRDKKSRLILKKPLH